jgi:hypothetical protein
MEGRSVSGEVVIGGVKGALLKMNSICLLEEGNVRAIDEWGREEEVGVRRVPKPADGRDEGVLI